MAGDTWISYLGAITGVVGTITGIAGTAMGFIGYRQSRMMKSLDLRLQLRKDAVALQAMVGQLPGLMDRGRSSRIAVLAASGLGRSGNAQIYLESWQRDSVAAEQLQSWARSLLDDYRHLAQPGLEMMLVEVHGRILDASSLNAKYTAE
jgi:hypothetical protein